VDDGVESILVDEETDKDPIIQLWKLNQSGLLVAKELLIEERKLFGSKELVVVDVLWLCQYAGLAIDCFVKLYEGEIDDDESVKMQFKLSGIKDKRLGSLQRERHISPIHFCRSEELIFESSKKFAEWKSDIVGHAIELCEYIFHRFNWTSPNLYEARKIIEDMFKRRIG
jgi:hypothetical protein